MKVPCLFEDQQIYFSKKKHIFYDKFKVTHLSHNSPFRFMPSHACRSCTPAVILYLFRSSPQSSFSRSTNIQTTANLPGNWAMANKNRCILPSIRISRTVFFHPQQLGDLSLTFSLCVDPEGSLNSIIKFSPAPQFPYRNRSIAI